MTCLTAPCSRIPPQFAGGIDGRGGSRLMFHRTEASGRAHLPARDGASQVRYHDSSPSPLGRNSSSSSIAPQRRLDPVPSGQSSFPSLKYSPTGDSARTL
jgi:hypothetical protein